MLLRPVNGRVTSKFGWRNIFPKFHNGVDFSVPTGTKVKAADDGEVVESVWHWQAGHMIKIQHSHGLTEYLHNSERLVKKGDKVKRGDTIALSGNTGNSTGPHLHFGYKVNNKWVDPLKHIGENMEEYQRKLKVGGKLRDKPTTKSAEKDRFKKGTVINFKGWVNGQNLSGNNVWFVGRKTGDYMWSGLFTSTSKKGLKDMNPKPKPPVLSPETLQKAIDANYREIKMHESDLAELRKAVKAINGKISKVKGVL